MNIKVLQLNDTPLPSIIDKGDWIDLYTAEEITLKAPYAKMLKRSNKDGEVERRREVKFDSMLIPLGIAVQVPKGCESIIVPRSSTFKKYGIIQTNSIGVIDYSYNSDEDEWKLPVVAFKDTTIPKGTRICQFKVQLSQKATVWQKLKWLFSNKVKITKVNSLNNEVRGGFGSTD